MKWFKRKSSKDKPNAAREAFRIQMVKLVEEIVCDFEVKYCLPYGKTRVQELSYEELYQVASTIITIYTRTDVPYNAANRTEQDLYTSAAVALFLRKIFRLMEEHTYLRNNAKQLEIPVEEEIEYEEYEECEEEE